MPKLLIVDDEPNVLYSLKSALAADGLGVVTARTARDGVRLAEVEAPDAVILDVRLPDQSGLEAFDRLRALDPRLPVVGPGRSVPVPVLRGVGRVGVPARSGHDQHDAPVGPPAPQERRKRVAPRPAWWISFRCTGRSGRPPARPRSSATTTGCWVRRTSRTAYRSGRRRRCRTARSS